MRSAKARCPVIKGLFNRTILSSQTKAPLKSLAHFIGKNKSGKTRNFRAGLRLNRCVQNFTGADMISVVNSRMMRRALLTVIALAGLGLTARADFDPIFGFYRPELFATVDGDALLRDLPLTGLLNASMPGSTTLGRMGTAPVANFSAALVSAEPKHPRAKANAVSGPVIDPKDGKDYSSVESLAMEKASLSWTGGEVGFLYGHSTGKFGGDLFSTYITGGVGNDHMQINVGAGYEESHFSRSRH